MKTLTTLLLLLCSSQVMAQPNQARYAGYTRSALNSTFAAIDRQNTQQAGFEWYIANWFGQGPTDISSVNVNNGVLTLGGGGYPSLLQTAIAQGPLYVGTVFGGGGYFEAMLSFNSSDSTKATGWPAFYLEPIEHIVQHGLDQWPGQAAGYAHFGEIDIVEFIHSAMADWTGSTRYLTGTHDWSGVWASPGGYPYNIVNLASSWVTVGTVDWGQPHKYGLLWVPQAGSTPGRLAYYFDDRLVYTLYYAGPVTAPPLTGQSAGSYSPTTPAQAAQTYAIVDSEHFAIRLQTDPAWPLTVYSVKVWQR